MWLTSSLNAAKTPTRIALGNFDGVHLGHRKVIQPILGDTSPPPELAFADPQAALTWMSLPNVQGYSNCYTHAGTDVFSSVTDNTVQEIWAPTDLVSTVLTFSPHPQVFFSGQPKTLLTPLDEKTLHLQAMGVEQLVLLPFNQALANLSPHDFVEDILIRQLQAQHISVGIDFRFGYQRQGDVDLLCRLATQHGVSVTVVPLKFAESQRISSSRIREALQVGNLTEAEKLLGRPYTLVGRVVRGQQLGRTIGFPTANLKVVDEKFLPCQGVYGVYVYGAGNSTADPPLLGVMNIGYRPTVGGLTQTIEVHILQWSGDLYGKVVMVDLVSFLRPERKFDSLDSLKIQIQADCEAAIAGFRLAPP